VHVDVTLAVVLTVRVLTPAALPVMARGLVELKLKVGGATAPLGPEVREAVRVTLPVKPPIGVMVIVEVFPVVAPGARSSVVPLTVKFGDMEGGPYNQRSFRGNELPTESRPLPPKSHR
jgi:hypothetical protein